MTGRRDRPPPDLRWWTLRVRGRLGVPTSLFAGLGLTAFSSMKLDPQVVLSATFAVGKTEPS